MQRGHRVMGCAEVVPHAVVAAQRLDRDTVREYRLRRGEGQKHCLARLYHRVTKAFGRDGPMGVLDHTCPPPKAQGGRIVQGLRWNFTH